MSCMMVRQYASGCGYSKCRLTCMLQVTSCAVSTVHCPSWMSSLFAYRLALSVPLRYDMFPPRRPVDGCGRSMPTVPTARCSTRSLFPVAIFARVGHVTTLCIRKCPSTSSRTQATDLLPSCSFRSGSSIRPEAQTVATAHVGR